MHALQLGTERDPWDRRENPVYVRVLSAQVVQRGAPHDLGGAAVCVWPHSLFTGHLLCPIFTVGALR